MEYKFENKVLPCMEACLRETRNSEETLEIRIPDGMPDAGKILASWGQSVLRSKEWRSDQISCSAGMMVWVLYQPDQGETPQCLEGWIPHSVRWELPKDTPEGDMCIDLQTQFVDARITTARKIIVRSGISAYAECWTRKDAQLYTPGKLPDSIQILRKKYPLRLVKEAGEKAFQIGEQLNLPPSAPKPEKLLFYTLSPAVTEKKIVANKFVFRGSANLHFLYEAKDGQLYTWDMPLSISQYGQLEESYGQTGAGEVLLCVTSLEVSLDGEGAIDVTVSMTAQYIVTEQELVEVVEDAYEPGRAVQLNSCQLSVPVILDTWKETVDVRRELAGKADIIVDTWVNVDYPRQRRTESGFDMEYPGQIQVLYYGSDGMLSSGTGRFEGKLPVKADIGCSLCSQLQRISEPQISMGADTMDASIQVPVQISVLQTGDLKMVSGISVGEAEKPDPNRPSLVIKRVGRTGLWDIAKAAGSTVEAIRKANNLEEDPKPGCMLLIPVSGQ